MSDELEVTPPQEDWNPPAGDLDFDALFGGAGDGSTDLSRETAPEPTKAPEPAAAEPPEAPPQEPPKQPKFYIKTRTGTVYDDEAKLVEGIEQKDQTIENLRRMVEAVTGADPLKRSSQTQTTNVSYSENPTRYAEDLTRAAEIGQKTKDWSMYAKVQDQFLLERLERYVGPYLPAVTKVGRQEVLDNVSKDIPGFKDFYGTEAYHKTLETRPKLAETIEAWEKQPADQRAQETLKELYELTWDTAQSKKIPELLTTNQQTSTSTQPRMPLSSTQLTPTQPPTNNSKPGLETSAGRKALMEQLERKGVRDFKF